MLEKVDVADVPAGAEAWEKVVRKLRTGAMPPAGRPRPDEATLRRRSRRGSRPRSIATAAARPNPGRTERLHRLNRAEYPERRSRSARARRSTSPRCCPPTT